MVGLTKRRVPRMTRGIMTKISRFSRLLAVALAFAVSGISVGTRPVLLHAAPPVAGVAEGLLRPRLLGLLDSEAGRYLIFETEAGRQVLRRSLGENSLAEAARDLTPLMDRLTDPSMAGVAERLEATLLRISGKSKSKLGSSAEDIFTPSVRRALSASESAELQALARLELKIDISFYPGEIFARGYDATRQYWLRAIEADLSAGRRILRYPKGVDPIKVPGSHLQFGFESEYTLDTAGRLLEAYAPAPEFGISAERWLRMRGEERVAWVREHISEIFEDVRTGGKLIKISNDAELAFLPERLILDSTGNLEIVLKPADTFEEWLFRVRKIESAFGAGSMQGTVGLKSQFFHSAEGVSSDALMNANIGWLNVLNEMDTLAKLEAGAARYAEKPTSECAKSFKHPYLGPMSRLKQDSLLSFLRANARGEKLDPATLQFVSGNDSSFKYIGGTAYRPDIARGITIFEVRDAHNQVPTLVERVVRATYHLQYGREPFAAAARLRAFDSVGDFEKLSQRLQQMLRDVFPPKFEPGVRYSSKELTAREYFRNFAYPMRDWSGWLRLLGNESAMSLQVKAAQDAYVRKLEEVAAALAAGAISREQASLRIQGAVAEFSVESGVSASFGEWMGRVARGDQAWAKYMDMSIRELGPLRDAFPMSVWEGSIETRLARFQSRWGDRVKVVDDVRFDFAGDGTTVSATSSRRVLAISTQGLDDAATKELVKDFTDAFSRGTVSFPVSEAGGHLYTRVGNKVADYAWGLNLRDYRTSTYGRKMEPFLSLSPQEELRLRFYVEQAAKNPGEVVGSFNMEGVASGRTAGTLRDNRPSSRTAGHNCTSWLCTSRVGDGDERLLELAGASVKQQVHTNPGWWLHFLSGAAEAERIPFVAIWDAERPLAEMLNGIKSGQTFSGWEFYLH